MKVSLVLPDFGGGGCERVFGHLATGLIDLGVEVEFVVARAAGPSLKCVPAQAAVVELGGGSTKAAVLRLARHLRRQPPDAVISGLNHANLMALAARSLARVRVPVIVTQHGVTSLDAKHESSLMDKLAFALLPRMYRLADAVVCVSRAVRDDLLGFADLPPAKLHVIYNPIVGPDLPAASRQAVDHAWLNSGHDDVVIAVGSLIPVKRFDLLLRVFARVRLERRARLIILGEGPGRRELEELARHLQIQEDVSLPGFVENPYAWLSKCAVFVLCSRSEALPTVVVEAMACGCRVVCTDSPGGTREILDNGRYGCLVPIGDETALASGIDRALAETANPVPDTWMEKFTTRFAASRYLELVREFADS
jgi:glycosyltransferase involved in cell wall biosynthesis